MYGFVIVRFVTQKSTKGKAKAVSLTSPSSWDDQPPEYSSVSRGSYNVTKEAVSLFDCLRACLTFNLFTF